MRLQFKHQKFQADAAKAVAQAGSVPVESGNEILVVSDVTQRFRWTGARSAYPLLRNLSALLPHFLQTSGAAVGDAGSVGETSDA